MENKAEGFDIYKKNVINNWKEIGKNNMKNKFTKMKINDTGNDQNDFLVGKTIIQLREQPTKPITIERNNESNPISTRLVPKVYSSTFFCHHSWKFSWYRSSINTSKVITHISNNDNRLESLSIKISFVDLFIFSFLDSFLSSSFTIYFINWLLGGQ